MQNKERVMALENIHPSQGYFNADQESNLQQSN